MKQLFFFLVLVCGISLCGCTQNSAHRKNKTLPADKKAGGSCEGCEAIYESAVSFEELNETDTLPDFNEQGPKMVISGIIYKADGITPAKDVVLYVYHTDQTGHYVNKYNEKGWAGRHGYIRGWIKTNEEGGYKFYTLKPAAYPDAEIPAHIHAVIKEPGITDYYIDEFLFNDDPFLNAAERKKQEGRGGNGIMSLEEKNGILYGERNIYPGRNIPGY